MIPLRRINEFALIFEMIQNKKYFLNSFEAKKIIEKYNNNVSDKSVEHTFNNLSKLSFFSGDDKHLLFTNEIATLLTNNLMKEYLIDCLSFGINKYGQEIGFVEYKYPFFKLNLQYKRRDMAICSNYSDKKSPPYFIPSVKGVENFTKNGKCLIINFLGGEYANQVISKNLIIWYSPNDSFQDKGLGSQIINHKNNNLNLYLFARKYNKNNPYYYYLGTADVVDYEGNKPIKFKLKLHNKLSDELYYQFIYNDNDEKISCH